MGKDPMLFLYIGWLAIAKKLIKFNSVEYFF